MKQSIRMMIWGALALVSSVCTAWAEYKPVDVSDIKGEQRKELMEAVRGVNKMPTLARDCYVCEQLGLCFLEDGSEGGYLYKGYPATTNHLGAKFVSKAGCLSAWQDAVNSAEGQWGKSWDEAHKFKSGAVLSFFKKDINRIVCNTAKYLLKEMPDVIRQAMLASIGRMLYKEDGTTLPASGYSARVRIGSGFDVNYNGNASDGYSFLDSTGKERSLKDVFAADSKKKRWRDTVRRCENLVGARDILALFPEEVKAMRKQYKHRLAQMKEQKDEANKALLAAADEMLASLPNEDLKYAKIAAAVGLYFEDHAKAGYNSSSGGLDPNVTIFLPNGKKLTGGDNLVNDTNPGILQQIPHEAILEHYREPITQMARHIAEDRFKEMPPIVRDLMRADVSNNLINAYGSPAKDLGGGFATVETHNRKWRVPMIHLKDWSKTFFVNSIGEKMPYSIVEQYKSYGQTMQLVRLCTLILGREEVLEYIPPAGENEEKDLLEASRKSAMGSTSPERAGSSRGAQYEEGIAALRRMSTGMRRAWLAENMGFCYTQSNAPAYTAPHIANDNALFVDEQGKERKLSEVATDKMTPDWVAATKAALAVGYEQIAAPFKEELQALAVQTATYILNTLPKEVRNSWLAEKNRFLFRSNGQPVSPVEGTSTLESGFQLQFVRYGGKLFYNPQGEITQPVAPPPNVWWVWLRRWHMLFRCADVAGIEAINAEFKEDVEAMRAAYEKSPFYKK